MAISIFVVEDEKAFVHVYDAIFRLAGFQLADWAFSGEEAVEKYRSRINNPDLVIMDHRLPGMNGVETMREFIKMDPSAKVLFVSADEKAKGMSLDNGAIAFILKPFSLADFINTINSNVSGRGRP
jgi:DNA-binding response OmpR family regulator